MSLCGTCGHEVSATRDDYHPACEPTTCTCATPLPDAIGECAGCHRLVLSHSWHEGRPGTARIADLIAEATP